MLYKYVKTDTFGLALPVDAIFQVKRAFDISLAAFLPLEESVMPEISGRNKYVGEYFGYMQGIVLGALTTLFHITLTTVT